jgi:hypothetical protein
MPATRQSRLSSPTKLQPMLRGLQSLLILFKIGHITCDNASNNDTMMEFFAKYVEEQTKKPFLFKDWHIW